MAGPTQEDQRRALARRGIVISPGSRILSRDVTIGPFTRVNGPIVIKGAGACRIGRYCAFGDGIHIVTGNHDTSRASLQGAMMRQHGFAGLLVSRGDIEIGHNVWIGDNVLVLSGAKIGDGAVIGAGAVVTREIPPFAVAAGVPACPHRVRFSEAIIAQLLDLAWWHWPPDRIARNKAFFELDLAANSDLDLSTIVVA